MFRLERYQGFKSRFTCPSCQARNVFARYVNLETKEYISPDVGRCNRESKCNYHYTPKDYFRNNPSVLNTNSQKIENNSLSRPLLIKPHTAESKTDYIEFNYLQKTLANYEQNAFVQFLLALFPEDQDLVCQAIKTYLIGTTREGKTIFWQIDQCRKIRTGKILAYDAVTGKRKKDIFPTWAHAELKRSKNLKEDFKLKQCFFGEHLLWPDLDKPAAIVEAEKTALIASLCFPELIWLAAGAKQNLKAEKLESLGSRRIVLYPDADSFLLWQEVAQEGRKSGLTVNVSTLIEKRATSEQKADGYDLADYLISEQRFINERNLEIDKYNMTVDHIIADEKLFADFNKLFDTRISTIASENNLDRFEAEQIATQYDNLRTIVLSVI